MSKKLKPKYKKILIGGVLTLVVSILLITLPLIILNLFKVKEYDLEKIGYILKEEYSDLYLTEMDHIDVLNDYGFEKYDLENALFLKSLKLDNDGNDITEDKNHIIIINTKDYEYYKDIFVSHIDSYLLHSEDKKEVKLYKKAIVKADKNYVYFILSKKAKDIEKTVNE